MSLLFNMLSRLVIAFLPRSKHLLISWLQLPSAVILEPKKIKFVTISIVSPSIWREVMALDAIILVSALCLLPYLHMSSAYLRLLIFLLEIMIPACASSSLAFRMMSSAYTLNKQGDNIQPWCSPFPIWNQLIVPCLVLTVASWPAYRFLRREIRWSGIPVSLRIFHHLLWSTQSKVLV